MIRIFKFVTFACISAFLITGCGINGEENKKKKLIIAMSATAESERSFERIEAVSEYLSKKLDMEVTHKLISNPSALIEAMRANKIHLGSGGPFTYLVASKVANAVPIVSTEDIKEGSIFRSCIITQANSTINSMEDLKARSENLTLSWAYPTSCSGHLVPRYVMQEEYDLLPGDFKEVMISTNHTSAIFTVISGKVDVAATYYSGLQRLIQEGRVNEDEIKYLWISEPMVSSPVFARQDLGSDLIQRIKDAYLDMEKDDPETFALIQNQYITDIKYVDVNDSDYQFYRDMANKVKGFDVKY
ncbi:phosphate/phosphite/phosphonate ABC transporter substrate-binding protein [Aquiflexum sp.]|uniref:phosphate/phosphite/phosphonate ABC transporter substrate-binding protein n=1 Tax=Aquiflexum sp. TaxID=1872584 RepID=UPI0035939DF4